MSKISIRFFNDREVRAIWDEANSKWWLKKKLNADGVQLVSVTHEFKFEAPDGKKRAADALDNECVEILAKHYPNNRANAFLDWFTYSDNTIDGKSKKKAYTFMESNLVADEDVGTVKSLYPDINWLSELYKGDERPVIIMRLDYSSDSQYNQALAKVKLLQDD